MRADSEVSALVRRCEDVTAGAVTSVPRRLGRSAPAQLPEAREFPNDAALFAALRAGQIDVAWTTTAAPDVPSEVVVLAGQARR